MIDYWEVANDRRKLRKQVKILRKALRYVAEGYCGVDDHTGDEERPDPACSGYFCIAQCALKEARAVR